MQHYIETISSTLKGNRGTFRHMIEKRKKRKKNNNTEMRKDNINGEIRTCPKVFAQPAVTSEKGAVVNAVRSASGVLLGIS